MKRVLATILLLSAFGATAKEASTVPKEWGPKAEVMTSSFLYFHPDLKYRMEGHQLFRDGRHEEAFAAFRRAARFADKAAQAMIGEMLWDGLGVPADRVQAYVWMDLAAERGYRNFVILRERYWARMSEAEREAAVENGAAIYEEFGDKVAKPRLEKRLRRGLRETTGSRTGAPGNLQIHVSTPSGYVTIDGSTYYADHYWKPETYFEWQDEIWHNPPVGTVEVGPLQQTPPPPPPADPAS